MSALANLHTDAVVAEGEKDREFAMTDADFRNIAAILCREAGISLSSSKSELVYSRLAKRVRKLGLGDFRQYCAFVESKNGAGERKELVTALTTNVTHFFRESHHFKTLETKILPALAEKANKGGRVRFWSAGCSNGQEPYSIAMSILSKIPNAADLDIKILATDIDSKVLEEARRGEYSDRSIAAAPADFKAKYFRQSKSDASGQWVVSHELKKLISFKELNLLRPWPIRGPFDAIFCRNVVIYFDEQTQQPLWGRFASVLDRNGFLFIGHSERITGPSAAQFELTHTTTYQFANRNPQ